MKVDLPQSLIRLIENAGAPVYAVGGCVRNALCSLGKTDIDLTGPLVATALRLPRGAYVRTVNFRLGTSVIDYMGETYEYTPFRTEKYKQGGAHSPSEIAFTADIAQDAARRDFTVNAIYYDPLRDELIDFFGGAEDCERRILRAHQPEKVFACDGLRILRLARLAAETGFKIDAETARVAISRGEYLNDLAPERIREELNRILQADVKYGTPGGHYRGVKLLARMKLWQYILPPVAACEGVEQNPQYHRYDVLEHTFQTVKFAPPEVRLAALMHDTGKPYCLRLFGNMHGHEKASESYARGCLGQAGLRYPNAQVEETARLCLYHMYDMAGLASEAKVRLFVAKNFDIIDKLTALINADRTGSGMLPPVAPHRFTEVRDKMVEEGTPLRVTDLRIDGNILAGLGLTGPAIGEELDALWRECVLNPKLNDEDWLLAHAQKRAARA